MAGSQSDKLRIRRLCSVGLEIVAGDFGLRGLVASDSKVGKAWGTP